MLKLNPVLSKKIWGYELWIASTHPNGRQQEFYEAAGGDYPLLIKIIQADSTLSVQVHPNDEQARILENGSGKTECWYVLDAKPGSQLIYGMNGQYSTEELRKAIENDNLNDYMRSVPVKKGDFIYIPAGTVHAIGGGLRLLETQQSSDITYRLYDWGRGRELHIEKGLQVLKNDGIRDIKPFSGKFVCPYFSLEQIDVRGGYCAVLDKPAVVKPSSWELFFVLNSDRAVIKSDADAKLPVTITAEEIYAAAPGEKITIEGRASLIRIKSLAG
ncbi:MAG: class I mannose-6-phosphate isomerase [Treponema sp.]|jgi:mannose-6-phosphate isomerase|nr:class I mannose-6-phosphate isomerase [Treponema sp.]